MLKPDVSLDRKAAYPSAHIPILPPEVQKLALTGVPQHPKLPNANWPMQPVTTLRAAVNMEYASIYGDVGVGLGIPYCCP